MNISLKEIINTLAVEVLKKDIENIENISISTDTRNIKTGDIYLPLKGANFDGEKFIKNALEEGAVGYITTQDVIYDKAKIVLKVENTLEFYMALASLYRKKLNPKTIALTGSSGKTTSKEILASVLSQNFKVHKTVLNHNNEIGFCQTVLSMPENTQVLILEMGMRGLGEIDLICKYALPDISIITNVGTAHIGRLGSRENIAKAKCEILNYQTSKGLLIAQEDELIKNTAKSDCQKIFYSLKNTNILLKEIGKTKFIYKNYEYELNIEGDYNVENSLAAIEVGLALGMSEDKIYEGLKAYKSIEKRWEYEDVAGYKFINDCYNANPESMKAALSTIFDLYPKAVIILGDMGELGENEVLYHEQIADFIANSTFDKSNIILTVGNLAKAISEKLNIFGFKSENFADTNSVTKYLLDNISCGNTIFLKASRSMKFENIPKHVKGETL